jgi:ABC-type polysaccharide/polyol phosphate transport system ATPase subunit
MEANIRLEGVWKKYLIGGSHYRSIREDLSRATAAVVRGVSKVIGAKVNVMPPRPIFWALKGLDIEIHPGERVGIIGPNGAGKTTTLRLMGRITKATKGRVSMHGRIGALIAVGAGIHPELSGRENIYLYGSIMGLKRREIQTKFDRIVAFSGVEEFLDTPVKYYSSGMRVRLGFSVALHVDPDIMLVDEVLSVGDFQFQKRCLDGIDEMARNGCTIVYVSHDLYSVKQTSRRVIFLSQGEVQYDGDPQEAINRYLDQTRSGEATLGGTTPSGRGVRWGSYEAVIDDVRLLNGDGQVTEAIACGDPLTVEISYQAPQPIPSPEFSMYVKRNDGMMMCASLASSDGLRLPELSGRGVLRARIEHFDCAPGSYAVSVAMADSTGLAFIDHHKDAYPFKVTSTRAGEGMLYYHVGWEAGAVDREQQAT